MTAAELASTVTAGEEVDWRRLEVVAFAGCPKVIDLIDPLEQYHTPSRAPRRAESAVTMVVGVLGLLLLFMPVFALATVLWGWFGAERPGPTATVPVAAVLSLIGGAALVVEYAVWWHGDRRPEWIYFWHSTTTWTLGTLTIAVALLFLWLDGSTDLAPWSLVIASPTLFGAIFARRLVRDARAVAPDTRRAERREEVAARRAAELPPPQQERIREDLDRAIDDLERRAVIDQDLATLARTAPLGTIAFRLDPLQPPAAGAG